MGVEHLRPPEIAEKFDEVKELIRSNESNTQRFKQLWDELEHLLGDNDLDLQLLKLDKMVKENSKNKFLISERVNSIHFEPGLH
jgi:hypothetical protein